MLTQTLRHLSTKSRSFSHLSHHFSTASSIIRYQVSDPPSDSHQIVSSFRSWFRTSNNPLFDRIFHILSSKDEKDLATIDLGLSQLGLRLTEAFVLKVLNYRKDDEDVLSCLKFFDWAGKQPGFHHTRATYVAIFKILSRAKLNDLMLDMLETFDKQRFMHKVRFNDMLVIGYALAGKVDVALQVFGKMRFNGVDLDMIGYHVLLNSLVEEGCFDTVRVVSEQIRMRGLQNEVTRALVVKSLCRQGKLQEAEEYVRDLVRRGEGVCGHMIGILVDRLCKEKRFLKVGKLIHELGEFGDVPLGEAYGVWVKNLVQAGMLDAAMEFFNAKKSLEGYVPQVYRYNILIHRLLKEDRLQEVCDLLMDMKGNRIVPDKVTMNAVLCFFCKAGMMDVAIELFKSKSEFRFTPHVLVYNYILNSLCGDGNTDEAYGMLKCSMSEGYFPGPKTFSILADALCREGKLDKMKDLVMFALERKFIPSDSTYEKFIRALCRARRVDDGYLIYGELSRLNKLTSERTYTYLICGFTDANRGDLAARLLIEMQEKGYKPTPKLFKNVVRCLSETEDEKHFLQLLEMQISRYGHDASTYSYFIFGAGHARKPELGRAVYEMMERYGIVPNMSADIYLLQCFLRSDKIADGLNFFDDVSRRRSLQRKLYNTMVVGLCRARKSEFALAILKEARNNGVTLSLQCYEELVKLYCSERKYDEAIGLVKDMETVGRKISSFIGNVFMLYSMHSRDLYMAWLRSRDTSQETPTSSMLGELIAVFTERIGEDYKVEDLVELIQKCFKLDIYSYNMLLRKLSMDHMDKACQLFNYLCQSDVEPNRWTYDILVHGLYKHGRIAEGDIWTEEMHRLGYAPGERFQLFV